MYMQLKISTFCMRRAERGISDLELLLTHYKDVIGSIPAGELDENHALAFFERLTVQGRPLETREAYRKALSSS